MKGITKEIKIGITAILAIIIVYLGIIFLKGINIFSNDNVYYIKLNDVNGLASQSDVLMHGMKIGTVENINYSQSDHYLTIEIEVNKEYRIPVGTTASMAKEMLGSTKINLTAPTVTTNYIEVGDTIVGIDSKDLMSTASEMVPQIQAVIPKLDSLLTNLNKITSNPSINSSLQNMEIITEDLKVTTGKINRMLSNDISPILTKTNNICQNLEATTSKFNNIDFVSLENNINNTLSNVNSFTNRLNNENSSLGLLLNDASVYNNLDSTFRNASLLLEDLRMNPKRYVHFSIFGRK